MKRRNWKRHQRSALRGRNALGPLAKRSQSKRKTWSFERLEDRHYFSATPLETTAADLPTTVQTDTATLSNSTPEGTALILMSEQQWNELQWAAMQSSGTSQSDPLTPRAITLPNDPLFASQWHLLNTGQEVGSSRFPPLYGVAGQDINVVPVWNMTRDDGGVGYTGKGVVVAVIDTGVQIGHPDLYENISDNFQYNAITGTNNPLPDLSDPENAHGTSVAGLIGATWNNATGGTGVAPNVTLVPIKLIGPGQDDDAIVRAFRYALDHGVDITNNSWGPADDRSISIIPTEIYDILRESALYGRNGLGMINVFAAGNGAAPGTAPFGDNWDSASYDPFVNSRYVIGVTGIDHDGMYANADGTYTTYPESGADVLVAAPTGSNFAQNVANDTGQGSGIWTTDLTGGYGFNAAPLPTGFDRDRDPLGDDDYTSRFNGTSASAPIASGVIALMLEANPNLTLRDVQEILVRSARTADWYEVPSAARGDVITGGSDGAGLANGAATGLSGGSSATARSGSSTTLVSPGGGSAIVQDWGDAPAPYPTLLVDNGARHLYDNTESDASRIRLGTGPDAEPDGQPDPFALGDDQNPPIAADDEDGVFIPTLNAGQTATLLVNAPNGGVLNGWIDFDHIFSVGWDPTDQVITDQLLFPGLNIITINVPAFVDAGPSFARFRITASVGQGGDSPTGLALNGEVEDYVVVIASSFTGGFGFGGSRDLYTTWQTNQTGPFRDPDPYFHAPNPNDPFAQPIPPGFVSPGSGKFIQWEDPLADPSIDFNFPDQGPNTFFSDASSGNDDGRQFESHYELMPGLFANGAGYTVSQGYGANGDQVGYAHGVIDAELAVQMAKQWHTLGQGIAPNTEKTVTTFVTGGGLIFAAEKMANNGMLVPGGIVAPGAKPGFSAYWNQYNADPPAPFDPAAAASWPQDTRGASYIDYVVAPKEQINVEWVEVRVTVSGPQNNLDFLRLMLTSPDGTQSELNDYFQDPFFIPNGAQVLSNPQFVIDPAGTLTDHTGGSFVWTFSSNRNWGESTNGAVILNPITGEPVAGPGGDPIIRNWELHIENWGAFPMTVGTVEIVWHGKEVAPPSQTLTFDPAFPPGTPGLYQTLPAGQNAWDQRWLHFAPNPVFDPADPVNDPRLPANQTPWEIPMAQRIQGSVGIDTTPDGNFNYNRYVQEINPFGASTYSAQTPRADDIIRRPDFTDVNQNGIFDFGTDIGRQEPFAANVVVSLYRVDKATNVPEATPTAYFLTGADGNFYFDVDPTYSWEVRITDPEGRDQLTDVTQPANYMKDYQPVWRITPDWFFAPDRDNVFGPNTATNFDLATGQLFKPGAVLWGVSDANGDGISTTGPMPYRYPVLDFQGAPVLDTAGNPVLRDPIPMAVKNINFLLRATPPAEQFAVTGSVFADLNADGSFNGNDARLPNVTVYVDANRDGVYEQGETSVFTDANGNYTLAVPSSVPGTFSIGVRLPGPNWQFKQPGTGVQDVTLPSFPLATADFALIAPVDAFPINQPPGALGWITGVVFNDLDADGVRDVNEPGVAGVRVFIDVDNNGIWDPNTESSALTVSNGSYVLANVTPANGIFVDVVIANEGTDNAVFTLTTPTAAQGGHRVVSIGAGGVVTGVMFGVVDRSGDDWGDLPFQTLAADNGPHHHVVSGFQLGATNSGEVNGQPSPTATADASDDGVVLVGGLLLPGVNTLQVTVFGVGGLLTGWMDFNGDSHFDESERLTWTLNGVNLGGETELVPNTYNLQITVPATAVGKRPIAARFRWGEPGLSFTGGAQIGEVEDYFFAFNASPGDFNLDGVVDQSDFIVWQKQKGTAVVPFSGADANGDGVVNQTDFDIWKNHFGQTYPGPGAGAVALTAGEDANHSSSPSGGGLSIEDISAVKNGSNTPVSSRDSVGQISQSLNQTQAAGELLAQPSSTTASPASGSSMSNSSLLTSFVANIGVSSSDASTSTSVVRSASVSDSSSSDLLLLDQTWATTDNSSFGDEHESLYNDESHDTVCANDLALAAVLNEEDEWWNAI